jgi:hypothetical protein
MSPLPSRPDQEHLLHLIIPDQTAKLHLAQATEEEECLNRMCRQMLRYLRPPKKGSLVAFTLIVLRTSSLLLIRQPDLPVLSQRMCPSDRVETVMCRHRLSQIAALRRDQISTTVTVGTSGLQD